MVITTHMIHQMASEAKKDRTLEDTDLEIIQSFLKNSENFDEKQKIISSHS
jgi:hypothetical protein